MTFHVKSGLDDPEFAKFTDYYNKVEEEIKNKKAAQRQKRREAAALKEQ